MSRRRIAPLISLFVRENVWVYVSLSSPHIYSWCVWIVFVCLKGVRFFCMCVCGGGGGGDSFTHSQAHLHVLKCRIKNEHPHVRQMTGTHWGCLADTSVCEIVCEEHVYVWEREWGKQNTLNTKWLVLLMISGYYQTVYKTLIDIILLLHNLCFQNLQYQIYRRK